MRIGPKIDLFNAKTICVDKADAEVAKEILCDFLKNVKIGRQPLESQYSVTDKIRMVIETLVFGWFIPGNRWSRKSPEE
jgi:hypothetical protein